MTKKKYRIEDEAVKFFKSLTKFMRLCYRLVRNKYRNKMDKFNDWAEGLRIMSFILFAISIVIERIKR
jgi:hypothetical protein